MPEYLGVRNARYLGARSALTWILGVAGMAAYNWWILVPFKPGLMRSPNELFSNLEVAGQPYATVMRHLDLTSGILVLAALLVAGIRSQPGERREWLGMVLFALAGAMGGIFSEVCADGVSATCERMEWHFQLPASQYIHDGAGIFEFAGITVALWLAYRRTRGQRTRFAAVYRNLLWAAIVAYPLLGVAYLVNRLGGVMEGVFFVGFTVMVLTQIAERAAGLRDGELPGSGSEAAPMPSRAKALVPSLDAGHESGASTVLTSGMRTVPGTDSPPPAPSSLSVSGR